MSRLEGLRRLTVGGSQHKMLCQNRMSRLEGLRHFTIVGKANKNDRPEPYVQIRRIKTTAVLIMKPVLKGQNRMSRLEGLRLRQVFLRLSLF